MDYKEKTVFPVVILFARDWEGDADEQPLDQPLNTEVGQICGWLIREDSIEVEITQEVFPLHSKKRFTTTIPKRCIIERILL